MTLACTRNDLTTHKTRYTLPTAPCSRRREKDDRAQNSPHCAFRETKQRDFRFFRFDLVSRSPTCRTRTKLPSTLPPTLLRHHTDPARASTRQHHRRKSRSTSERISMVMDQDGVIDTVRRPSRRSRVIPMVAHRTAARGATSLLTTMSRRKVVHWAWLRTAERRWSRCPCLDLSKPCHRSYLGVTPLC